VSFRQILIIGAVVLFILGALFFFGLGSVATATAAGLVAVGLACYAAAAVVP
jgi:hypothetical protein